MQIIDVVGTSVPASPTTHANGAQAAGFKRRANGDIMDAHRNAGSIVYDASTYRVECQGEPVDVLAHVDTLADACALLFRTHAQEDMRSRGLFVREPEVSP